MHWRKKPWGAEGARESRPVECSRLPCPLNHLHVTLICSDAAPGHTNGCTAQPTLPSPHMLLFAPPHGSLRPLGACWGAHQRPCGQRLSGPNRLVLTPARAAPSSRQPCGLRVLAAAAAPGEDLRAPPAAAAAPAASTGGAAERAPSQPNKGTLFGAIALITGSTVGAGMLALPAVSAPAGIIPTSVSRRRRRAALLCGGLAWHGCCPARRLQPLQPCMQAVRCLPLLLRMHACMHVWPRSPRPAHPRRPPPGCRLPP